MFAYKASAQQGTRMFRAKILSKCAFRRKMSSRLVLGIETSCDETGAAVMDETGLILGESLHSQKEVHMKWVQSCIFFNKSDCLIYQCHTPLGQESR